MVISDAGNITLGATLDFGEKWWGITTETEVPCLNTSIRVILALLHALFRSVGLAGVLVNRKGVSFKVFHTFAFPFDNLRI